MGLELQERKENGEKTGELLAKILTLCESNPDAGLELIEQITKKEREAESNPFWKWAKAMAYGSKGLFQALRELQLTDEQLGEVYTLGAWEFRQKLRLTENQLDFLETALREIREIEKIEPSFVGKIGTEEEPLGEAKVDGIATALERCRPGRVQQILGKTKLLYFGAKRIKDLPFDILSQQPLQLTKEDFRSFRGTFFDFHSIAKSALVVHQGADDKERKFIWIQLFGKTFDEFSPDETFGDARPSMSLYDVQLFNDGTFAPYQVKEEEKT